MACIGVALGIMISAVHSEPIIIQQALSKLDFHSTTILVHVAAVIPLMEIQPNW